MKVHSQVVLFSLAQQRSVILFAKLGLIKITAIDRVYNPFTHNLEAVVREYTANRFMDAMLKKLILIFHDKYAQAAAERLLRCNLIKIEK